MKRLYDMTPAELTAAAETARKHGNERLVLIYEDQIALIARVVEDYKRHTQTAGADLRGFRNGPTAEERAFQESLKDSAEVKS